MQKLILGRALLSPDGSAPRLIVAHQPTWGLDIGAVAYVQKQLLAARDAGAAVLLTTHDMAEAAELADRVHIVDAGRVSVSGTVGELARAGSLEDAYLRHTTGDRP